MTDGADVTYLTLDDLLRIEEYASTLKMRYPGGRIPTPNGITEVQLITEIIKTNKLKARINKSFAEGFDNGRQ